MAGGSYNQGTFGAKISSNNPDVTSLERLVAAVDWIHIPITQPYHNSQDFFAYKMKYKINVQHAIIRDIF